jgi:peptidoglycan/xylan/chitin deacetylase (PgdA/CDA1 family)
VLTIVAYHYVRDLAASAFPKLAALDRAAFERQLDHIAGAYSVVGPEAVYDAVTDGPPLPENACLLTFDDGYRDHAETAAPALARRGWLGLFFPAADAVTKRDLLEVNAIHFVAAASDDRAALAGEVAALVEETREAGTPSPADLRDRWHRPGRWDDADTRFVKGVLQQALPAGQRRTVIDTLFHRHVSDDPQGFADALYLDREAISSMRDAGMAFGSHGACHRRMTELDDKALDADLDASLALLESCGISTGEGWSLCYPHGAHNRRVAAAARRKGCAMAVTVEPRVADPGTDDPLALPRLDTNDLPQ